MPSTCVCDSIYGVKHSVCEPATQYLCDSIAATIAEPAFSFNGRSIDQSQAVQQAASLLREAKYPLFTGINWLGIQSQQSVIDLCRYVNGVVDTFPTNSGRSSSTLSIAREGKIEATMGEVIDRSKAILVIDCAPDQSHPRFFKSLSCSNRDWFWIGANRNSHSDFTNWLAVDQSDLDNVLVGLHAILQNTPIHNRLNGISFKSSSANKSLAEIFQQWGENILQQDHACIIHDSSSIEPEFDLHCDLITSIARCMNSRCRAVALDVACHGNDLGAQSVLTWSSGFPNAADFTQMFPRSFAMEFSADNVCKRKECDVVFSFRNDLEECGLDFDGESKIVFSNGHSHESESGLNFRGMGFVEDTFMRFDNVAFKIGSLKELNSTVATFVNRIRSLI